MNQGDLSTTTECPSIIKRAKLRPGNSSDKTNCAIIDAVKRNVRNITEISTSSNNIKLLNVENL